MYGSLTLLLCASFLPAHNEMAEIVDGLRTALALKGTKYPYYAEYALAMPPRPRIAGSTEKRRLIASSTETLYGEVIRDSYQMRILLKSQNLYGEYTDPDETHLFRGPIQLGGELPDKWLKAHGFWDIAYTDLDHDLVPFVRELLTDAKVTGQTQAPDSKSFTLSTSALGTVEVIVTKSQFQILGSPHGDRSKKKGTILHYSYHEGKPVWRPDPSVALLAAFDKADHKAVHVLKGEMKLALILEELFPGNNEYQTITLKEAREFARRYRCLFPTTNLAAIRKAGRYRKDLELVFEVGGKRYFISQGPPSTRFLDMSDIMPDITKCRRFKDYTILEIYSRGTERRFIYYMRKDALLLVGSDKQDFKDRTMDTIVDTFAPVLKEARKGRAP